MKIISARGFSEVRIAQIAQELHCSVGSLYKIAPSKDSLVLLALASWEEVTFENIEDSSRRGETSSEQARIYFRSGARSIASLSHEFRVDTERFESTRAAWQRISDRFIDRFVELVGCAAEAGEIRPINHRFLGEMLRQVATVVRDERALGASGLTAAQAVLEVDEVVWDGIAVR
jgi:AcrR family transcriptional regulator